MHGLLRSRRDLFFALGRRQVLQAHTPAALQR